MTVLDPDWNGMVKVDLSGKVKYYHDIDLKAAGWVGNYRSSDSN